jgi:hypothetical protein
MKKKTIDIEKGAHSSEEGVRKSREKCGKVRATNVFKSVFHL